eukprot:gene8801-10433_t
MDQLFANRPGMRMGTINPSMPLPWETVEDAGEREGSDGMDAEARRSMISLAQGEHLTFNRHAQELQQCYVSAAAFQATAAALQGFEYYPDQVAMALGAAEEAIALCPECTEALVLHTLCVSTTQSEVEKGLRRAVESAGRCIKGLWTEEWPRAREHGEAWGQLDLRAVYRAYLGLANALRKQGGQARWREALNIHLKLGEVQEKLPQFNGHLMNHASHVPELYLHLGQPDEAIKFMDDWQRRDPGFCLRSSVKYTWPYARLLARWLQGRRWSAKELLQLNDRFQEAGGLPHLSVKHLDGYGWAFVATGAGAKGFFACVSVPATARGRVPPTLASKAGDMPANFNETQLDNLLHAQGALWRRHPEAVKWARQLANMAACSLHLLHVSNAPLGTFMDAARDVGYLEPTAALYEGGESLLERCVLTGPVVSQNDFPSVNAQQAGERVVALLALLPAQSAAKMVARCTDCSGLTPWHKACYYDVGDYQVAALLAATGAPEAEKFGPMEMAANQGNWRPLEQILESMGTARVSKALLGNLAEHALQSSVFLCLAGLQKCQRCMDPRDQNPHAERASFERVLDVLVRFGLDEVPPQKQAWKAHKLECGKSVTYEDVD